VPRYTTTNLRFPIERYEELRYHANRRGTSVASIVREAVAQYLGHTEPSRGVPFGDDPLDRLAGSVIGGATDESVNHDHYLYGSPKEDPGETARGHRSVTGVPVEKRSAPSGRRKVRPGEPKRTIRAEQPDSQRSSDAHSRSHRRRPSRRDRS
jgi:hypothetical protein